MQYKGYTITNDGIGSKAWNISNEVGILMSCSTLNKCKEWINENPIDDFIAITIFGEIPCDRYNYNGISSLVDFLKKESTCDGYITRRVFKTKAECMAYSQGVADMCGWSEQMPITEQEYKQIMKKVE